MNYFSYHNNKELIAILQKRINRDNLKDIFTRKDTPLEAFKRVLDKHDGNVYKFYRSITGPYKYDLHVWVQENCCSFCDEITTPENETVDEDNKSNTILAKIKKHFNIRACNAVFSRTQEKKDIIWNISWKQVAKEDPEIFMRRLCKRDYYMMCLWAGSLK